MFQQSGVIWRKIHTPKIFLLHTKLQV
jgi:hypothetical protein